MSAPAKILELVKRFDDNANDYRADKYNEANLRQQLINSLPGKLKMPSNSRSNSGEEWPSHS